MRNVQVRGVMAALAGNNQSFRLRQRIEPAVGLVLRQGSPQPGAAKRAAAGTSLIKFSRCYVGLRSNLSSGQERQKWTAGHSPLS
jgi:hypothetical protein